MDEKIKAAIDTLAAEVLAANPTLKSSDRAWQLVLHDFRDSYSRLVEIAKKASEQPTAVPE